MSLDRVSESVASLSLMLRLGDETRSTVVSSLREVSQFEELSPDAYLFREGDEPSNDAYVLLTGSVTVETAEGFSTQVIAPELLGEMKQFGLGGTRRRTASVFAAEPSEVLHFNWADLYTLLEKRLSTSGLQEFQDALRGYAWMHFLEREEEV